MEAGNSPGEEGNTDRKETSNLTSSAALLSIFHEFLKIMGHISANIRAEVDDNKNYEDGESWDSNALADLGVGFLQVGGETPEVSHQDQGVVLSIKEV